MTLTHKNFLIEALYEKLNKNSYIVPALGDTGDRILSDDVD